jgi:hypothetical protein
MDQGEPFQGLIETAFSWQAVKRAEANVPGDVRRSKAGVNEIENSASRLNKCRKHSRLGQFF